MQKALLIILCSFFCSGISNAQFRLETDPKKMAERMRSGEVQVASEVRYINAQYDSDKEKYVPYARSIDKIRWSNYKDKELYLQIIRIGVANTMSFPLPEAVRRSNDLVFEIVDIDLDQELEKKYLDESDSLKRAQYLDSIANTGDINIIFDSVGAKDKLVQYNCTFEGQKYQFYSMHSWLCHDPFCGSKHGHMNFESISFFSPDLGMIYTGYYGIRFPDYNLPYEVVMYILNQSNLHETELDLYKKQLKKDWDSFRVH